MFGILTMFGILLLIIIVCETIIYHQRKNGVTQEVIPSIYSPDHMNIVTRVIYNGVTIRNFCEQAHKHEAKWVAFRRVKSAKQFYKVNKKTGL
jgi:hypothetical protein